MPLESIPAFIARLQACYQRATGTKMPQGKKSPGSGPKATIAKKDKNKKEKKPKEKKAPPKKMSMEDLDAELVGYTAQRGAEDVPIAEEPAAVPVE